MDVSSLVDLRPLVDQIVIPIVIPLLGSLASWGVWRIVSLIGLHISASQQAVVNSGLNMAINYASTKVEGFIPGKITVDTKSDVTAVAAQYALDHIPDALSYFGATDKTKLVAMIEARLGIPDPSAPAPAAT